MYEKVSRCQHSICWPYLLKTILLTSLAMIAFAANSLLGRAAFADGLIDPTSFTSIRLASGGLVLWLLVYGKNSGKKSQGSWLSACFLFFYAAPFSFAYIRLEAGTGALILFAFVQVTMMGWIGLRGKPPKKLQLIGMFMAMAGLVTLTLPGLRTPDPWGAALMAVAGMAWGAYSLRGQGLQNPLATTGANFRMAVLMSLGLSIGTFSQIQIQPWGLLWAVLSGSLASGLGYSLWYAALRGLSGHQAAVIQLVVPILASGGGILFLGETLTLRFILASLMILGGIGIALRSR